VKGILERNAMRYYLALEAFFATRHLPEPERFEARIDYWFELTSRFPRQLWEMEREEYLLTKRLEWRQQQRLQKEFHGSGHRHGALSFPGSS
jgi:hypothetical protein